MNELLLNTINGENIAIIVPYGRNRSISILNHHRRLMVDHFGFNINYVECPFPGVSHGFILNELIKQLGGLKGIDYILFMENDSIFLRKDALEFIYNIVKNKVTIFGQAWQSNHKKGPNGNIQHAYAGPACLCFHHDLYYRLNAPDLDHNIARSDTAEELTYKAKELGYNVCLFYPSHVEEPNTDLDNGCKTGLGNTYQDLFFHASQAGHTRHEEVFVKKCEDVLNGKNG